MSQTLAELVQALSMTKYSENVFVGKPIDLGLRQLYGGLIFAQAISAVIQYADMTLSIEKQLHYATASFINAGQVDSPIYYEIAPLRVGKSFSVMEVKVIQNGIQLISMQASFHIPEHGFSHQQSKLTDIAAPETLENEFELAKKLSHLIPEPIRMHWTTEPAFEVRPEVPLNPFYGKPAQAIHKAWFKLNGQVLNLSPFLRYALIAYHSDHNLLPATLKPHGKGFLEKDMQVATLNHAIWFHNDIILDDWLAYIITSPIANNALALVRGEIFDRMGKLIATTQQEGLIRQHPRTKNVT
ncbi:acyl-CoA thioesterase [Thorsellia anophelis]|uniref:Acyl-CoA thioesterase-2 n=1 Tax=Thorsellia anophelis DSM 18579 TaxID=1123402 RepID=A0A1H9ZZA9_9GAMM|nr:acyl-CoA thioesterase II [Thorsellia anophelis]SES87102.1 acyl-CoA thioesterase-2 [Thorsellia anophelis DSM 18579]